MFEAFKRFIERLAKSNEEEFKGQNPDCCTINQPERQSQAMHIVLMRGMHGGKGHHKKGDVDN